MIAVLQRCKDCQVVIDEKIYSKIIDGYLIFLGVVKGDKIEDLNKLSQKILSLKLFKENNKNFSKTLQDSEKELMIVSQFTLSAEFKKGKKPDFSQAEEYQKAKALYQEFISKFKSIKIVKSGKFGADMKIDLKNIGPITLILDSKKL